MTSLDDLKNELKGLQNNMQELIAERGRAFDEGIGFASTPIMKAGKLTGEYTFSEKTLAAQKKLPILTKQIEKLNRQIGDLSNKIGSEEAKAAKASAPKAARASAPSSSDTYTAPTSEFKRTTPEERAALEQKWKEEAEAEVKAMIAASKRRGGKRTKRRGGKRTKRRGGKRTRRKRGGKRTRRKTGGDVTAPLPTALQAHSSVRRHKAKKAKKAGRVSAMRELAAVLGPDPYIGKDGKKYINPKKAKKIRNIYKRLYPEDKEETRFNQEYFVISGGKRTRRKTGGKRTRRKRTRSRTKINY